MPTFTQALVNAGYGRDNFYLINNIKLKCKSWDNGHYVICTKPSCSQIYEPWDGMKLKVAKEIISFLCINYAFKESFDECRFELSQLDEVYPSDDWEVIK